MDGHPKLVHSDSFEINRTSLGSNGLFYDAHGESPTELMVSWCFPMAKLNLATH